MAAASLATEMEGRNSEADCDIISLIISDLDKVLAENGAEEEEEEEDRIEGTPRTGAELQKKVDVLASLNGAPPLPSVGSKGHAEGLCRPCAHNWKAAGCSKGWSCTFCHVCGEEDFMRKRKDNIAKRRAKRSLARQLVPGSNEGDSGAVAERSEPGKGDTSEDIASTPDEAESVLTTGNSGRDAVLHLKLCHRLEKRTGALNPTAMTGPPGLEPAWVPVSSPTLEWQHGGVLIEKLSHVGALLKVSAGSGPEQGWAPRAVVSSPYSLEEQETATPPSSSDDGPELRTPPCGQPTAALAPPSWSFSKDNADGLSDYGSGIVDSWTGAPLGEPARVELVAAGPCEVAPGTGIAAAGWPSPRRCSPSPTRVDEPTLEPAWVMWPQCMTPRKVAPQQEAPLSCSFGYQNITSSPFPFTSSEGQSKLEEDGAIDASSYWDCRRPPPGLEAPPPGSLAKAALQGQRPVAPGPRTPRRPPGIVKEDELSVGSAGHSEGTCRPCAHIWKPSGCSKGTACEFCHACGEEDFQRRRKQNAARRKVKAAAAAGQVARRSLPQHSEHERRTGEANLAISL